MEVHAHTHTARKKWTHYFWEFLMLFLAVFCGFIAENQREHMIEHKREKEFMRSLKNDLLLDAAWLDTVTKSINARIQNIDSALMILGQQQTREIPMQVYRQLRRSMVQVQFFSNNGTITQLKNSGGMRLIRQRAVVDSIEQYDRLMRRQDMRREITLEHSHDFAEVLNKVLVGKDVLNTIHDQVLRADHPVKRTIGLNNQYTDELINQCISVRLRAVSDIAANISIKLTAKRLIDFISEKYHLK